MKKTLLIFLTLFSCYSDDIQKIDKIKSTLEIKQQLVDNARSATLHKTACGYYNDIVTYLKTTCSGLEYLPICSDSQYKIYQNCKDYKD